MKKISSGLAAQLIKETRGRMFSATFIKKNGEVRTINARLGVKKHLKGGVMKYNPYDLGYLPVFDMKTKGYRMINLNTLKAVTVDSNEYEVV